MDRRFYEKNTSLEDRTYEVITSLQTKAASTQGPILSQLENQPGVRPGSVNPLWITNVILADLRKEAILQLSRRADMEVIDVSFG